MRHIIIIAFLALNCLDLHGQRFVYPAKSRIYADTFLVWIQPGPGKKQVDGTVVIESRFGDRFFETVPKDSLIVLPYYSDFDVEPLILVELDEGLNRRTHKRVTEFIEFTPMPRNDSVEFSILRVTKEPTEKNLLHLAQLFERERCFGNAFFTYHKLYRLGYPHHWNDFLERIRKELMRKAVLR